MSYVITIAPENPYLIVNYKAISKIMLEEGAICYTQTRYQALSLVKSFYRVGEKPSIQKENENHFRVFLNSGGKKFDNYVKLLESGERITGLTRGKMSYIMRRYKDRAFPKKVQLAYGKSEEGYFLELLKNA